MSELEQPWTDELLMELSRRIIEGGDELLESERSLYLKLRSIRDLRGPGKNEMTMAAELEALRARVATCESALHRIVMRTLEPNAKAELGNINVIARHALGQAVPGSLDIALHTLAMGLAEIGKGVLVVLVRGQGGTGIGWGFFSSEILLHLDRRSAVWSELAEGSFIIAMNNLDPRRKI